MRQIDWDGPPEQIRIKHKTLPRTTLGAQMERKHVNTSSTDDTDDRFPAHSYTLGYRLSKNAGKYTSEVIKSVCDWYVSQTRKPGYEEAISDVMHLLGMMHQVTLAEVREIIKYRLKELDTSDPEALAMGTEETTV